VSRPDDAFARAVREALAAPLDGPLATRFGAPLVTALIADVADATDGADGADRAGEAPLAIALAELGEALERIGVPRGRQFVLLGHADGVERPGGEIASVLRRTLSVPVLLREPSGACFRAGRLADGTPIELDDELREAEAIVAVGRCSALPGSISGGPYLLVPGLCSAATRRALAAARDGSGERAALAFSLAAHALAPVDLALVWDDAGQSIAGSGGAVFSALARCAGLA